MKKLINKTIILSLFVALTGCNDWLDVSPKAVPSLFLSYFLFF